MRQQTKAESVCISLVALISCLTLGNELSRWASPLCLALQLGHHLYTQLFLCIMLHTMTLQSPKACLPAVTHLEVAGCCASWLDLLLLAVTCKTLRVHLLGTAGNKHKRERRKKGFLDCTGFIKTRSAVEHSCKHFTWAKKGWSLAPALPTLISGLPV